MLAIVQRQSSLPVEVDDGFNLLSEGVIDSLGFLALIAEMEQVLGSAIDLSELDADQLACVGPLSRHIAAMVSAAAGQAHRS